MSLVKLLTATPPAMEKIADEKVDSTYTRKRISVFTSIYIAYAAYYIIRDDFTVSSPYLIKYCGFDKATIGLILSLLAISYGISKFLMGSLADKSNPRYYIATGLIGSALLNFIFGTTSNKYVMMILIVLMGIFQGMGAPAAHKTLAAWFSNRERGTYISIWNTSHNVGGGLIPLIVTATIAIFGVSHWQNIFFVPSIISIILALIVVFLGEDTPESIGLPSINKYHHEETIEAKIDYYHLPLLTIIKESVLKRPYIWLLAIANATVYIARYGIENWIPIYLHTMKGFSLAQARSCFSIYEFAAIPGTILIGIISDKLFKGKRSKIGATLMLLLGLVFAGYWFTTAHSLIYVEVGIMGILVYGPQMLITALAIDLVPRFAVGSTDGFVGLFGYIFGEVIASYVIGALVDKIGWIASFWTIIIATIVSLVCFIALVHAEKTIDQQLNKIYQHLENIAN